MAKIWEPGQKRETAEERELRLSRNEQMLALPYSAKVNAAAVDINICTEIFVNHRRTFDMPTRTAFSPR